MAFFETCVSAASPSASGPLLIGVGPDDEGALPPPPPLRSAFSLDIAELAFFETLVSAASPSASGPLLTFWAEPLSESSLPPPPLRSAFSLDMAELAFFDSFFCEPSSWGTSSSPPPRLRRSVLGDEGAPPPILTWRSLSMIPLILRVLVLRPSIVATFGPPWIVAAIVDRLGSGRWAPPWSPPPLMAARRRFSSRSLASAQASSSSSARRAQVRARPKFSSSRAARAARTSVRAASAWRSWSA